MKIDVNRTNINLIDFIISSFCILTKPLFTIPLKRNLGVEKIIQTKDQIVYLMHTTQEHEMNFLYKSLLKAEKESEAISRMFSKSSLS